MPAPQARAVACPETLDADPLFATDPPVKNGAHAACALIYLDEMRLPGTEILLENVEYMSH